MEFQGFLTQCPLGIMNKYIYFIFIILSNNLFSQRNRHVELEWNTSSICLNEDFLVASESWYYLDWLGAYYQTYDFWIYHCDKGWLFPESDGNLGVWFFWDRSQSWIWTRWDIYPMAYDSFNGEWFDFCVKPDSIKL